MSAAASLPDHARKALGRRWLLGIVSLFLASLAAGFALKIRFGVTLYRTATWG